MLPDSPSSTSWLKPEERRYLEFVYVKHRGGAKRNAEGEKRFRWDVLWSVVKDRQLYFRDLIFASNCVPNYGLKFTLPQIVRNMGFKSSETQLLNAPPYVFGAAAGCSPIALSGACPS